MKFGSGRWNSKWIYFNSSYLLRKTYLRYNELFEAKACEEAAEYLTDVTNKLRRTKFIRACSADSSELGPYEHGRRISIVLLGTGRARVVVEVIYDVKGSKVARKQVLTWLLDPETSTWRRHWPD